MRKAAKLKGGSGDADRIFSIRLMEHLVVPTFVIDRHHRVVIWNRACERLTGLSAETLTGTTDHWRAFYTERRPTLADAVARGDYDAIRDSGQWSAVGLSDFGASAEVWCTMPALGRRHYLALDAGPIYNETGGLIAVVETIRDITTQKESQTLLETLAAKDALTGLPNRRSFDQVLAAELCQAAANDTTLSLLMIDVDCFKAFNDSYGHQAGDECLVTVAATIARALRKDQDRAARYGGEEFAVILPRTGPDEAEALAERVLSAVGALRIPHTASIVKPWVSLSIGVATIAGTEATPARLVARADEALYRAKRTGRDRIVSDSEDVALELF